MEFNHSYQDEQKRIEFHSLDAIQNQIRVKRMTQTEIIKAIDELTEVIEANIQRINQLRVYKIKFTSDYENLLLKRGIVKYEKLSQLSKIVCEIYLMLLDIYTYSTYCLIADDEWDWRAFARHIYTILYEHTKTVNKNLNDIIKILQDGLDKDIDLSSIVDAKKDFSFFIRKNSDFAKEIRVNVDAHFQGDYLKRLDLIKNLSYSSFVKIYYDYISKMQKFLFELRPALLKFRRSADSIYYSLLTHSIL